jgi:hypothetical protein
MVVEEISLAGQIRKQYLDNLLLSISFAILLIFAFFFLQFQNMVLFSGSVFFDYSFAQNVKPPPPVHDLWNTINHEKFVPHGGAYSAMMGGYITRPCSERRSSRWPPGAYWPGGSR